MLRLLTLKMSLKAGRQGTSMYLKLNSKEIWDANFQVSLYTTTPKPEISDLLANSDPICLNKSAIFKSPMMMLYNKEIAISKNSITLKRKKLII